MVKITLDLTDDEAAALRETVAFDAGLDESAGGHPASETLLAKIEAALRGA